MSKKIWLFLFTLTGFLLTKQPAWSQIDEQVSSLGNYNYRDVESKNLVTDNSMSQINNVNQLRDVQPTDWAYEALRSLVERYGCIVGYPDRTFRGNRVLSRYEFAAGLNACMQQMERLIAESEAVLREDIEILKRLMKEFEVELAHLGTRVDNLEGRVAFLEDHQFSATTKLMGSAVFALADVYGGDGGKNQTVFQERVTLNLATSFTGKDLLLTSLWSGNVPADFGFDIAGTDVQGIPISSAEGTLSSQFGANTDGDVKMIFMSYQFPVGDRLRFYVGLECHQGWHTQTHGCHR